MNKFTPVLFFCLKNCLKISSWVVFSLKKYLNRISSFCFVWLKRQFWLICRYHLTHSRGLFVSRWPWKMQIWWPFNNSEASRTSVSLPAPSAPLCAPYEMKGPLVTCWSCYSECERTVRMTCSLLFFTQMQLWVAQTLKLELLQLRNIKYHILQHWDTWPYPRAKGIFHVAVYLTLSELNSDGWLHGNRSTAELPEHIQATLRHPSLCVISRWVLLEVCVCICNTVLSADGYPVTLVRYGLNIQDEDCGISWAASPARCSVNC